MTDERREFVGRWAGRIMTGAEDEHAQFIAWLGTSDGAQLLQRCNLTEYAVYQQGSELEVVFKAERPSIIAGFLRNKRLWPRGWEFLHTGAADAGSGADDAAPRREVLVHWTRA